MQLPFHAWTDFSMNLAPAEGNVWEEFSTYTQHKEYLLGHTSGQEVRLARFNQKVHPSIPRKPGVGGVVLMIQKGSGIAIFSWSELIVGKLVPCSVQDWPALVSA